MMTTLMYLKEPDGGGETNFPYGIFYNDYLIKHLKHPRTKCSRSTVASFPLRRSALVFYNMDVANQYVDEDSRHAGCEVLEGTKWTGTLWIHQSSYHKIDYPLEELRQILPPDNLSKFLMEENNKHSLL